MADLLDDAFTNDMVGQAAEGLGADDIVDSAVDQFEHLTGQEPALAGLVSERDNILGIFCQILNVGRRREVTAGLELSGGGSADLLHELDAYVGKSRRWISSCQALPP